MVFGSDLLGFCCSSCRAGPHVVVFPLWPPAATVIGSLGSSCRCRLLFIWLPPRPLMGRRSGPARCLPLPRSPWSCLLLVCYSSRRFPLRSSASPSGCRFLLLVLTGRSGLATFFLKPKKSLSCCPPFFLVSQSFGLTISLTSQYP